jgi:hypothetical protein
MQLNENLGNVPRSGSTLDVYQNRLVLRSQVLVLSLNLLNTDLQGWGTSRQLSWYRTCRLYKETMA